MLSGYLAFVEVPASSRAFFNFSIFLLPYQLDAANNNAIFTPPPPPLFSNVILYRLKLFVNIVYSYFLFLIDFLYYNLYNKYQLGGN